MESKTTSTASPRLFACLTWSPAGDPALRGGTAQRRARLEFFGFVHDAQATATELLDDPTVRPVPVTTVITG